MIVVVERLPHPHEHEIAHAIASRREHVAYVAHLRDDLAGCQLSRKTHLPCRAEDTSHGATSLSAETRRETAGIPHDDRFNLLAIFESQEELLGAAVAADDAIGDIDTGQEIAWPIGQPAANRSGQIVNRGAPVEHPPERTGVYGPNPGSRQFVRRLGKREIRQPPGR